MICPPMPIGSPSGSAVQRVMLTHNSSATTLASDGVNRSRMRENTSKPRRRKAILEASRSTPLRLWLAPSMQTYDVVIIGGGHNGLTCAAYLGMAGLKVKVLERRAIVGGAAVTEEFCPGFRNSVAAYTVSLLNPKVIADLRLFDYGLKIV